MFRLIFPCYSIIRQDEFWNLHVEGVERPLCHYAYYSDFASAAFLFRQLMLALPQLKDLWAAGYYVYDMCAEIWWTSTGDDYKSH